MTTFMQQTSQLKLPVLIMGAVAVTLGSSWSSAINALIDSYIPQKYANSKNAWVKILYSLLLTIIVAIIVYGYQNYV